jgi:phosphoglucosamine mutase
MDLFGTSGIRGVFGDKISPELSYRIGVALGNLGFAKLFVGNDHRLTSPLLSMALQAGALAGGCGVKNLGLCPTSVVAWNGKVSGADACAIITASHNPPEYNGIKLHDSRGAGFDSEACAKIEELLVKAPHYVKWDVVKDSVPFDGITPYTNTVVDELGSKNNIKVVLDCNHGAAGVISPDLLKKIGCDVVPLRNKPNGTWRITRTYQNPKIGDWGGIADLQELIDKVKNSGADLGLVHDGDADRVFAVNANGPIIPDILMAAIAKLMKKEVVVSVDTSMVIEEFVKVTRVPVGDVAISRALVNKKNAWGGEPSGTFVWPEFSLCPDGVRSAALIVSLWDKLKNELENIPQYPMERIRIKCPNEKKQKVLDEVVKKAESMGDVSRVDGVRVKTDQAWFLIRPSGTEPVMRIVAEAKDQKSLGEVLKTAKSLIKL